MRRRIERALQRLGGERVEAMLRVVQRVQSIIERRAVAVDQPHLLTGAIEPLDFALGSKQLGEDPFLVAHDLTKRSQHRPPSALQCTTRRTARGFPGCNHAGADVLHCRKQ